MSKIIDFDNYKKNNGEQAEKTSFSGRIESMTQVILNALMENHSYFEKDSLMYEAFGISIGNIGQMLVYLAVTDNAISAIKRAGLDSDKFSVDDDSFDYFMNNIHSNSMSVKEFNKALDMDDDRALEVLWNGPYYDCILENKKYRAAATVLMDDVNGSTINVDILRLNNGKHNWEIYYQGKWIQGPPEAFFDYLSSMREDWLEDVFDDESDDDWEDSIDSMMLPPGVLASLHKAGIDEIEQLKQMTDGEILKIKGIGKKTLRLIRDELEDVF